MAVLVVDNDKRIVEATTALLQSIGHRVKGVQNTAEALQWCDWAEIILADYLLDDGESGLSLIEAVRERRPGMPAVLITAESADLIRERASAMGVPILAKPAAAADIEALLADASVLVVKSQ